MCIDGIDQSRLCQKRCEEYGRNEGDVCWTRTRMRCGLEDLARMEVPCWRPQRMMMCSACLLYFLAMLWMTGCWEAGSARRMTALALVQGVPSGQYALTWMPSLPQNSIRSSLRHSGCTSTCMHTTA